MHKYIQYIYTYIYIYIYIYIYSYIYEVVLFTVYPAADMLAGACGKGIGAEEKRGKSNIFWHPAQKKNIPGQIAQTPWADTGDFVGRIRCYRCSTLFNYNCNLSLCGSFWKNCSLFRIIVDYCRPQKRPTIWIWVQLLWAFGHFEH